MGSCHQGTQTVITEKLASFPRPEQPELMIEILELVFKTASWNKKMVLMKIFGIAMGTPLAPALANLYLAFLERKGR